MQKLKTLDLFAGIGGFSLGLERTGGFETAAFCEIDKKAQLVLRKHWPNVPIFEDVSELSKEKLDAVPPPHQRNSAALRDHRKRLSPSLSRIGSRFTRDQ